MRYAWYISGNLSILGFSLVALSRWKTKSDHPWKVLGLDLDRTTLLDFLAGFLIAALVMTGIFSVEQTAGLIQVPSRRSPDLFILFGFLWFLPRAFAEELFCRGFMLNGFCLLVRGKYLWLAIAVSSIAFGFIHALNPDASELSVLGNALGGVVYAVAYWRSGNLWLGTGLHFGWNFVQGTILGFPVSGMRMAGLFQPTATGDILLSGGGYGPEAGLVGIGFRLVAIAAILLWTSRNRNRWQCGEQPLETIQK